MRDTNAIDVRLRSYGADDLWLLTRLLGDPAETAHLGGPASAEQLAARHQRYLDQPESDGGLFAVVTGPDDAAVGWVGFWETTWRGENAWECGWHVLPEYQGRGVAAAAAALMFERARERNRYRYVYAFPSEGNTASNALCRRLGFELLGQADVEYPKGHTMHSNEWRLNLRSLAVNAPEIRTERLLLRPWRPQDREPFAALNADPEVMRYFPSTLSRAESDAVADRIQHHAQANGYDFAAVQVPGIAPFIGFAGLSFVTEKFPFAPAVQIGWRLAREHWGHGYATEAARAWLDWGFESLGCDEIVSFAVEGNTRSRAVMERLGMTHDPADDFDHFKLSEGHPLRRHVLYRTRIM
ncbi:MAG: GNAT family N-acetyltransferase [Coriobacteriia bacterium]